MEIKLNRACAHVKADGCTCGVYALRDSELCYWHHKARESRAGREERNQLTASKPTGIVLPLLEDANAVQVAIQMVAQAVADRRITKAESGSLLYSIQLAIMNMKNLQLQEPVYSLRTEVVPTEGEEDEDLLGPVEIPMEEDPEFRKSALADDDDLEDEEEMEELEEFLKDNWVRLKKLLPGKLDHLEEAVMGRAVRAG